MRSRTAAPPTRVSLDDARRLVVLAQRLAGPRPAADRRGALRVIEDIGYLQLDPTNVVARNPRQVLASRIGPHQPDVLEDLLTRRRLFETVSLVVPTSDLAIHAAAMRRYRAATSGRGEPGPRGTLAGAGGGTWVARAARFLALHPGLRREVLGRLRRDGPLPLRAFADRAMVGWTTGAWTDERNVSGMLEVLQRRGEVVVAERRGGHKVWALAEGWLPAAERPAPTELERRATERAVRSMGLATLQQLRRHYAYSRHVTPRALAGLEREGRVVRVCVDPVGASHVRRRIAPMGQAAATARRRRPVSGEVFYALAGVERRVREARAGWEGRTTLLSPFDNLIIDRDRADLLFDFFYKMEIYVPPARRVRGFWAMPILHGERIIGTVDPRADRERDRLIVGRIIAEPGAPGGRRVARAIERAVEELAEIAGVDEVRWQRRLAWPA